MKRPMLVSGIVLTIAFALITTVPESVVVILSCSVSVLFLCFFKKIRQHIIIPVTAVCMILSVVFSFAFFKSKIEPCIPYHNTTHNIQGKVVSVSASDDYGTGRLIVQTTEIDGKDAKHNIEVTVSIDKANDIDLYDFIFISEAYLYIPTDDNLDYDFSNIADGVLLCADAAEITYISDAERTPYYYCLSLKEIISDRINQAMSDENGPLLKGMLFGEKGDIPYDTYRNFRNSGIAHLLAVSGLHTALWCGIILAVLKALKLKERVSAVICLLFLAGFVIVSSFTPSVIRASIMMLSLLIAPLFNRRSDSLNSLGLAVTLILISNPYNVLSVSFQLSAAATLGVLCSLKPQEKLFSATSRIPLDILRRLVNSVLATVCVSIFASVFTFPVSAYRFGVFNLLSPLGNLLCITLSFYGMISGISGIAVSFISTPITKGLFFSLIEITEFILDLVTSLAGLVSKIPFATVPVHKEYLLPGLTVAGIVTFIGYVIYKNKFKNKYFKSSVAVISLLIFAVFTAIPLTVKPHSTTLTIVSSGNNLHIIIRSGTDYAYISSASERSYSTDTYLPKATCETLRFYIPTYLSGSASYDIEKIPYWYSPEEVRISEYMYQSFISQGISLPQNTIIKLQDKYTLSDEITFEIIDTSSIKYAIIKSNEKTVFVHLHGELNTSALQYMEDCDVVITNGIVPEIIPESTDTLIISSDATVTTDRNINSLSRICNDVYITARHGTIKIPL